MLGNFYMHKQKFSEILNEHFQKSIKLFFIVKPPLQICYDAWRTTNIVFSSVEINYIFFLSKRYVLVYLKDIWNYQLTI